MAIDKELLDRLLADRDPEDVFGKDGLLDDLKKALSERILHVEMDEHLDGEGGSQAGNRRNGSSQKTVLTDTSKIVLDIPRDRAGRFDPRLIAKYQRRFPGFDEKIISMYARGMTVREIRGHLEELYGIDASPDLISTITDAVMETVTEWQNRPLEACYPLVFFDAIRVKIRDEGFVRNKAVYIALGILPDGTKESLGIWIEQSEGAKPVLGLDPRIRLKSLPPTPIGGHERAEKSGRAGHPHRRRGRAQRLSRCHYRRFPANHGPDPGSGSGAGSASCI